MDERITLDHGSGGEKTDRLIRELIIKYLGNEALNELGDAAVLNATGRLVFSTDNFVVSPVFFPGGDIGKLSVCGTVNDVSVRGGDPKYLSLGLIIEEGFPVSALERVLDSIGRTAKETGVLVVTGDTKVVEQGKGDGIYINTAGIGFLLREGLGMAAVREGDSVILSGTAGDHGTAILLARNAHLLEGDISSDCAPVCALTKKLISLGDALKIMRDPTRGGIATTLCEFAEDLEKDGLGIELVQGKIPVAPAVSSACEILGIDPYYLACEGRLLAIVSPEKEAEALALLKSEPQGQDAAVIGQVTAAHPGRVILKTGFAGRVLTKLSGEPLPRIC